MTRVAIDSFGPVRPWVRPGGRVAVEAVLRAGAAVEADVEVALVDVGHEVTSTSAGRVRLAPEPTMVALDLDLPDVPRHGYGLRLTVTPFDGPAARASAAVEALEGWWQSPRHAAITDYREAAASAEATSALVDWNVSVVQHYDWMWRHYRYRPPDGATDFRDALGRMVSHEAVRAAIDAGHGRGIASLAYGSVYGAEAEHVERHPDERVFDETGEPLSLGGTFFINDLRPGASWRERLLAEYEGAVEAFDFDGIHMDTYGPPHMATGVDGGPIDFAALYPGLIAEADSRLRRRAPASRVLFNCVEGFPLQSIAPAPVAALYLELWPPDDGYADVVRWIDQARAVADGRAVVIAAYAATLKEPLEEDDRPAALETVYLLGSIIAAAGAYHHTLAEGDRLLVEGYYPAAVPMTPTEAHELRALWRFTARYLHLLSDPGLAVVERPAVELVDGAGVPVPLMGEPSAGAVWLRETRTPSGSRVLHIVDLREQADASWIRPKTPRPPEDDLWIRWGGGSPLLAMSPWSDEGDALELDAGAVVRLPPFRRWLMLIA